MSLRSASRFVSARIIVGFIDQSRGNGRVVFSSKVKNVCEVRIISISVTTQRYASSAEEADVTSTFHYSFSIVSVILFAR